MTMSLTSRNFGLLNLAAGWWVILGGWLCVWIVSGLTGTATAAVERPSAFGVGLLVLMVQAGIVWWCYDTFRTNALMYLFVSLGVALLLNTVIGSFLLRTYAANTAYASSTMWYSALVVAIVLVWLVIFRVSRSRSWARATLLHRIREDTTARFYVAPLVAAECTCYLVIGAAGVTVHKGVLEQAELLTVISVLAVVAGRFRPLIAATVAAGVVVATRFVVGFAGSTDLPFTSSGQAATFSTEIAILLLVLVVMVPRISSLSTANAPSNARLPVSFLRKQTQGILRHTSLIGIAAVIGLAGLAIVLLDSSMLSLTQTSLLRAGMMCGLFMLAWVTTRYLGVNTILWPALAVIAVYAIAHSAGSIARLVTVLTIGMIVVLTMFWVLRLLDEKTALLLDLSVFVVGAHIFSKMHHLSGRDQRLAFPESAVEFLQDSPVVLLALLPLVLPVPIALYLDGSRRGRMWTLSLADMRAGLMLRLRPTLRFFQLGAVVIIGAFLGAMGSYSSRDAANYEVLSLDQGLFIMLVASLCRRGSLLAGVIVIGFVYLVVEVVAAGSGALLPLAVGLFFLIAPLVHKDAL